MSYKTPLLVQAMLGTEVAVVVGLWFISLVFVITYEPIKNAFAKAHYYLMRVMGGILVLFGVKLAFETLN